MLDESLSPDVALAVSSRLLDWSSCLGRSAGSPKIQAGHTRHPGSPVIRCSRSSAAPSHPEGYNLTVSTKGVLIQFRETCGLHAAIGTLRQLLREYGRKLPCIMIRDWPDFPRRGVMLDISRGRVPTLSTLLNLADHLADFKINELQLYTEHTFAYRKYKSVWGGWGALTSVEIRKLDAHCRELGIDLVPNQNSFGHLRYFLEEPRLRKLAEVSAPYEDASGEFVRRPTTLAPNHPATLPFLRGLYEELLPNFSSRFFNVGCDETWDLGRGQSKRICQRRGKGRVYLNFLKQIQREVAKRGKRMMFWGDIILHHPALIKELPGDLVAMNWGYEAGHPFEKETALFAKSRIPFYVCPGTSTWMTLIGRHDNALANLREAATAGRKHGAIGYLITDWGDGGHPQPLAVSWVPYVAGASAAWCSRSFDEKKLVPVLSRDIFHDPTGQIAKSAMGMGLAHRKLRFVASNETPLGTVIAAPPRRKRELFCRQGLNHHTRIAAKHIHSALSEIERHRIALGRARPFTLEGRTLVHELRLAAAMAALSCRFMIWQQSVAAGNNSHARRLARTILSQLRRVQCKFEAFWPLRNKGTPVHCSPFLQWRQSDCLRWLKQRD